MAFDETDLFPSGPASARVVEMADGRVVLHDYFFPKEEADAYYRRLKETIAWQQEEIRMYGKTHLSPRLTAWYGDTGAEYNYSGVKHHPLPWTAELASIQAQAELAAEHSFNSVLLNFYRDGKDGMGWHRDNEPELGKDPVIASVSFGETRPFRLRHKFNKEIPSIELPLHHGSLLIMSGETQHYWEHQVPKTARQLHPRINLTFRSVKSPVK